MEYLTPSNIELALSVLFAVAGLPKLLGVAKKPFADHLGYSQAWFSYLVGVLEVGGAAMLHFSKEYVEEGLLLLLVIMGGGVYTMLKKMPPMALQPAMIAYGIYICLKAHNSADAKIIAGALALGVAGGLLLHRTGGGKKGKVAKRLGRPAKAAPKAKGK